jgi:modulator of FtsH protease
MSSNAVSYGSRPLTRDESSTLFGRTMMLVAATAAFFALGVYAARDISPGWSWVFFVASFAVLFGISAAVQRSGQAAIALLFAFGSLLGASVASVIGYAAGSDPETLWKAGAATALFVAAFGTAGYATRRDLSNLARLLNWALFGLIIFGLVAVLVQIPSGSILYAVLGLLIFAGLTSYDFQRLRRSKDIRTAPLLAASIFLDILNVFFLFVSFWGGGGDE